MVEPSSLDLAVIGNSNVNALIDPRGRYVWSCLPRLDGDPVFCRLLEPAGAHAHSGAAAERASPAVDAHDGELSVELVDHQSARQRYARNTAIVVTRLDDEHGGVVEITDFAPRFRQFGRLFAPMQFVRIVSRISGNPRIVLRLRPLFAYGRERPAVTFGSNHVRYVGPEFALRVTTDASISALLEERPFLLEGSVTLILGTDETLDGSVQEVGRRFLELTHDYWQQWVRNLAIPFEWQEAVIRAAITLKLNACDDTGAVVAAVTTSIPEAAHSGRTWDYRYCWLRDAYFVVNALNRLGATATMERYLRFILNVIANSPSGGALQPVYGINGRARLDEVVASGLSGYRGHGPVRIGNLAYIQTQNDVYGSAILAGAHAFFDERLPQADPHDLYTRFEQLGEQAVKVFDQPDAGLWELRGAKRVHTFSSVMCWAAADRLGRIAAHLQRRDRAAYWQSHAERMHAIIVRRSFDPKMGCFMSHFGGATLDASLLLLADIGFLSAQDPRFRSTVETIGHTLGRGDFLLRYDEVDDFGAPENAFIVCTFWYIQALAAIGERERAREHFERVLQRRNPHGLLSEDIAFGSGELWGNFPQTYSMVGLINCAIRLSKRWDEAF